MPPRGRPAARKVAADTKADHASDKKDKPKSHPSVRKAEQHEAKKKGGGCCGGGIGPDEFDESLVLRVHLIAAKELEAKDDAERGVSKWGTSDPYCIVSAGMEVTRTPWLEKTLNPEWNQVVEFTDFQPETCFREVEIKREDGTKEWKTTSALNLEVWDHDDDAPDTIIGKTVIELPEMWSTVEEDPDKCFDRTYREEDGFGTPFPDGRREYLTVKKEAWGASGASGPPGSEMICLELEGVGEEEGQKTGTVMVQCLIMHKWQIEERTEILAREKFENSHRKEQQNLERVYTQHTMSKQSQLRDTISGMPSIDKHSNDLPSTGLEDKND